MTVYKDAARFRPTPLSRRTRCSSTVVHRRRAVALRYEVEEPYEFGGAKVGGFLLESRLKELMPPVPPGPSAVGYLGTSTTSAWRPAFYHAPRAARLMSFWPP